MTSELITFTEYEEGINFDVDDPDFTAPESKPMPTTRNNGFACAMEARVPSPMSLAGVQNGVSADGLLIRSQSFSTLGRSYGSLSSLEDVHTFINQNEHAVLTIEELRLQLNSCFTCGVSWQDEHVSLDCSECGGYSLERPCPVCDGQCGQKWKRDLTMTHACGNAKWDGKCALKHKKRCQESEVQLCQRFESLKS